MATSITHALRKIKDELDSHLTLREIQDACQVCGHKWRDRVLGPAQTVQALLLQILHATAMTGVSRLVGLSFSASAYWQALQRLPVEVVRTLLHQFVARRRADTAEAARWHGLRVFLTDGSSCSMAALLGHGVHAVIRLHGLRHVSFASKQYTLAGVDWPWRLGHDDQLVIWRKSKVPSRVLSREAYDALPEWLILRELPFRVTRRGYRTWRINLVTTLLDPQTYPATDLAALYRRRWQVEVNLRHMKETLGMRVLRSQTEAGVERELLAFALLYNVVWSVMTIIALHLQTTPERISLMKECRRVGTRFDKLAVNFQGMLQLAIINRFLRLLFSDRT